ncbi:MAG: glycosyltransferase [Pseudomonadota bacterium]
MPDRMGAADFDIVIVVDPRFSGGTGAAVAAEAEAAARAGYSVGLAGYQAGNITLPFPVNPRLARLIDLGTLTPIPPGAPARCRLALVHNPYTATRLPLEALRLTAEDRVMVVHHPPVDAYGVPSYDLDRVVRHAEEMLNGPVAWAPVGPLARAAFADIPDAPALTDDDWTNVIDLDAWRRPFRPWAGGTVTMGRHSRPDMRKWPDTREAALEIYGDTPDVAVEILGASDELAQMMAPLPASWRLMDFDAMPVRDFLDRLDVFVYYHRADWIEAFGYAVLEALARGVPCVLPPSFAGPFADAVTLAPPAAARETALAIARDPDEARRLAEAAWSVVETRHGHAAVRARLEARIGPPPGRAAPRRRAPSAMRPSVMMVSTNGVGMGHLTRQLAIARRLPETVSTVFATMSRAGRVVEDFGYHVEHIPFHGHLDCDVRAWNHALGHEIAALIDTFDTRVLVFDGNCPFQGVIDALRLRPEVWGVWCRRGMWREGTGEAFIRRSTAFDMVLEPRDLAGAFDRGLTVEDRERTREVGPVRLLDRHERLPRDLARAELGLTPGKTAVLVQLGAGNNYDYAGAQALLVRLLGGRDDVEVVRLEWTIAEQQVSPEELPANFRILRTFPVSRLIAAFDLSVSAVGYNGFHECIDAGLPMILLPNENPKQDDQIGRARFAERRNIAALVRIEQVERLGEALERLLDPGERADMTAGMAPLATPNGAVDAARILAELAMIRRGDRAG